MHKSSQKLEKLQEELRCLDKQQAILRLRCLDDVSLWELYKLGNEIALVILFKKYNRHAMLLVYKRLNDSQGIRWAQVEDATADFMERILAGKYKDVALKKNFLAFMVQYVTGLAKDKLKLATNSKVQRLDMGTMDLRYSSNYLRVEDKIDLKKVIDFIPKIPNHAYRMVLYLVFILGYNSNDLTEVFGKREKAYDKRSRAMKAFRLVLEKEGILDELR